MTSPSPRIGILKIKPHMISTPSQDFHAAQIVLSSNESALGPSPIAAAAARASVDHIERYPEDGASRLAAAIGAAFGLDAARIVCGHGSDDLLTKLTRAYLSEGDELIHSRHGYLKFPNYAYAQDATPVAAPDEKYCASVDGILASVTPRTRVVMLANPDNPTGTHLSGSEVRRLHAGLPSDVLLVLDCAYAEYATTQDYEIPISLINSADNVVMTRTFSKVFGLAGMRLGWLYGPPAIANVLPRISSTFPISAPAVAAGIASVEDTEHVEKVRQHNRIWRDWMSKKLSDLGLLVYPSNTNFILVRIDGPKYSAEAAYKFLLKRGIVTRMFNSSAYQSMLRITIGLKTEMEAAAATMGDYLDC